MKNEGFTLVELMVVVAIIGLLSAVAIPNFRKYQAKSKTSEAKLQLASLYSSQTAFYSDYDFYTGNCLNLMGFDPSNEITARYYAVGFGAGDVYGASAVVNGAPDGCIAANGTLVANAVIVGLTSGYKSFGAGKLFQGSSMSGTNVPASYTTDGSSFTAAAIGNVDRAFISTSNNSEWSVSSDKFMKQVRAGY